MLFQIPGQCTRLRNCLKNVLLPLFHITEHIGPMAHFRNRHLVKPSRALFTVPADKRYSGPFGKKLCAVFHLPLLYSKASCDLVDIYDLQAVIIFNVRFHFLCHQLRLNCISHGIPA